MSPYFHKIQNLSIEELLKYIENYKYDSFQSAQVRYTIIARCADRIVEAFGSLESSMNENAESSSRLAEKVFWLNIILTAATCIGTALTIYAMFFKNTPQ